MTGTTGDETNKGAGVSVGCAVGFVATLVKIFVTESPATAGMKVGAVIACVSDLVKVESPGVFH